MSAYLNERQVGEAEPLIVNLASIEYARVVQRKLLRAHVVDCVFEEGQGDDARVISFFAKKARGLMARHAVLQRATTLAQIESFSAEGYALDSAASAPQRLVFRRAPVPRRQA